MTIEISDAAAAGPHVLGRGDEVVLRLEENPTTGYRWQIAQSGAGELGLVDDRFVPGAGDTAPGAGGHRIVRFVGRQPGEVRLEAVLRRSWEATGVSQQRVFVVIVS